MKSSFTALGVSLFALSVLVVGIGAYVMYEQTPCGLSHAAKSRILDTLSPQDASTLRASYSIAEPDCPDVFSYRQNDRLIQETAWTIVNEGMPNGGNACRFEGLRLEGHYQIVAAFAPLRDEKEFYRPNDKKPWHDVDVVVDSNVPTVLMLLGHGHYSWNITTAKASRILAIFVNGATQQRIIGVDPLIPTYISTRDNHGGCGWLYDSGAQDDIDATARHLFGRAPDRTYRPGNTKEKLIRISES